MKKGAYDLGRKAVYYITVIVIIAFLFAYMTNNFRRYQIIRMSNLDELTDLVMLNNIIKCVAKIDKDTGRIYLDTIDEAKIDKDLLVKCLGEKKPYTDKAIKLQIGEKKMIETQEPYFDYTLYERDVKYKGKEEKLRINIEKYPQLKE